ncbi:MAG: CRTAC1 family protein, partial [Planctomycetes bacterium]|nr:CRTAC1 family protein [Planctomycetota bacterium]
DVSATTGIDFRHTDGSTGTRYIVETVTAGVALFDYDNDGDIDIYFLNGAPTPGDVSDKPPRNALYRNDGDWHFTDVTEAAGVGDTGFGLGVAVGDYNNDGDLDVYVNNFGPNVLYHNNGDGTFRAVTEAAGVACGDKVGAGACFLDIEGDGDLDLYCANYVQFRYGIDKGKQLLVGGYPQYRSPKEYEPEPDVLYRNEGDGTFVDVSREAGIGEHGGTGMGIVCVDYDNDADTDIAVLNDVRGNFLFENDGKGRFREVGLLTGFGYNVDGMALGSMGIDCADFDNNGWLDLFQTAYATELPVLYSNTGVGFFEDVTRTTEAGIKTYPHVNWGVGFADFDNDADRDLFLANGHLQDNVEEYSDSTAYEVRNTVLMNSGGRKFIDVSDACGDGLLPKRSSRGTGLDDLDNDGDIDVVILNARREPTILRNESATGNHWIEIRLCGTRSNRDGVGAHVRVFTGDKVQLDEVHSGRGYQSHHGSRLHFGLGRSDRVDRIEVRWVGGGVDVLEGVGVDRLVTIIEGRPGS